MHEAFSRRGFTRLALLGGAGLLVPRIALADDAPPLGARIEAEAIDAFLFVTLHLANPGPAREVIGHGLRLDGRLVGPGAARTALALEEHRDPMQLRSRAGPRLRRSLLLAAESETTYGRFVASIEPRHRRGLARLEIRTVVPRSADAQFIAPLDGLTARTEVAVPA